MKKIKFIISILILITILCLNTKAQAKYTYNEIETTVKFKIDRTAPKVNVTYIDYDDYVHVIIKSEEQIKNVEGWQINEERTIITKDYYENTQEQVRIYDISDNYIDVNIFVNSIIKDEIIIGVNSITNSNKEYKQYANNSNEIEILYEVKSYSEIIEGLSNEEIIVKVNGNIENNCIKEINLLNSNKENNTYQYLLKIRNIEGNGILDVEIKENAMKTKKNAVNMPYTCYTGILIDNIAPDAKFSEQVTNSGFANVTISFNEFVREKDGWNFSEDKMSMSKEFPENVSYMINIMDYAGNTKEVEIHITLATYVELVYGSHNSNVGWSFGYGNYDIAGKDATLWSWINKTESLVFNIRGNVDKDFLQAKAYIYSYWKDTLGYCQNTNLTYNYGHNPSDKTWKSMADRQLAIIDGVEYFQFGGAGMNYNAHPDITGGNFIPSELAVNYPYGISAIAFRLKDYSKYSVIYQICIANHGWLEPKYNGDETSLGYTIPMSAIRMAIIPNSELQELYDFWNKDTGTFNM